VVGAVLAEPVLVQLAGRVVGGAGEAAAVQRYRYQIASQVRAVRAGLLASGRPMTLNGLDLGLEARLRHHQLCNPLSYLPSGAGGAPSWKEQDEARRKTSQELKCQAATDD
jgi:hypothetical protein